MSKKFIFLAGALIFFLFVFFSYLVHEDIFTQFDFDTTVRLQNNIPRRLDELFSYFSVIGSFDITLPILLILLFLRRKIWSGIIGFGLFGLFHIIELFGKFFVDHLPPPHFMLRTTDALQSFPQFYVRAEFSYPSGHSGRALFLTTLLFFSIFYMKRLPLVGKVLLILGLMGYDFIMLVSRVYLGEHWSTDVIGGTLLGLSLGIIHEVCTMRKKEGIQKIKPAV